MMFVLILLFCSSVSGLTYPDYNNHYCKRKCDGTTLTCHYDFTVQQWYSMNPDCRNCLNGTESDCYSDNCIVGDGSQRLLSVINRRFPGPSIHVCKGDKVVVTLKNEYSDYGTSLHWHGQDVRRTPFMDGVRMITQCPIPLVTTFKYVFYTEPAGTFFYHAHVGTQKSDGAIGALIVREPSEVNPLYDYDLYEHTITIAEMSLYSGAETLYRRYVLKIPGSSIISAITINGFGANATNKIPPYTFVVKQGFRYRFRAIQAGPEYCITKLHIEKHNTLTVISTDGRDIEEVTVESINMMNGERFDFVIHANQPPGYYWIVAEGYGDCKNKSGIALLKYEGAEDKPENFKGDLTSPPGPSMNCVEGIYTENCYYYYQLKSKQEMDRKLKGIPTFKYYISHDMIPNAIPQYRGVKGENLRYGVFNNISFLSPSTNMLEGGIEGTFCNASHKYNCDSDSDVCRCTHVIQIPYKASVELIIVDEGKGLNQSHAIHLHGNGFYVVAQEHLSDKPITLDYVKKLDDEGKLKRNLNSPAIKDTLATPNKGYAIIRFEANNEGYWFYHCHINSHLLAGFSMVIKVGNPSAPPKDFPKCGNYLREDF